jgi:hypothetical protein
MLDLINRLTTLVSDGLPSGPYEQRTSNGIALNPGCAALASLHPSQLLEFTVKRLNLPTDGRCTGNESVRCSRQSVCLRPYRRRPARRWGQLAERVGHSPSAGEVLTSHRANNG